MEQIAVVVYGVVTFILVAALAIMQHSVLGMTLVTVAAALTYLFQFIQLARGDGEGLTYLLLTIFVLTIASVLVSALG